MVGYTRVYRERFGVEPVCAVLPITPSTYYAHRARTKDPARREPAASAEAAAAELYRFEASPYGKRFAAVVRSWRWRTEEVIPFFSFSPEMRKILYTTNAIESRHSQVRKAIRNNGYFPSEEAATKLIYLALRNITAKSKNPRREWHAAKAQFAIQFTDRFMLTV